MSTPKEQQLESLPWITSMISIWDYERSLNILVWNKFLNRSRKHLLLKRFRNYIEMSYEDWSNGRYTAGLKGIRRRIKKPE